MDLINGNQFGSLGNNENSNRLKFKVRLWSPIHQKSYHKLYSILMRNLRSKKENGDLVN